MTKIQLREWIQRFGFNNFETVSKCFPENSSAAGSIIADDCQIKRSMVLFIKIQQKSYFELNLSKFKKIHVFKKIPAHLRSLLSFNTVFKRVFVS